MAAIGVDYGAQHLVALDEEIPRFLEPLHVDAVIAVGAVDTGVLVLDVELRGNTSKRQFRVSADPVRLLNVREGEGLVPVVGIRRDHRRTVGGPLRQSRGEFGQGGVEEQVRQLRSGDALGSEQADEASREETVSAECEEVVIAAYGAHAQEIRPCPRHLLLQRTGRPRRGAAGSSRGGAPGLRARRGELGQSSTVDLPVRGQREGFDRHDLARYRIGGQTFGEEGGQGLRVVDALDERYEPAPLAITGRDADSSFNIRMSGEGGVDFAQFDSVSANFHLRIGPPRELQRAVRPVSSEVACPVPALAVALDELLGGARRVAAISLGDACSADPDLALDPVGTIAAVAIHHAEVLIAKRVSVGNGAPSVWNAGDVERVGPDRRLGGAAESHEAASGRQLAHPRGQVERHPVA